MSCWSVFTRRGGLVDSLLAQRQDGSSCGASEQGGLDTLCDALERSALLTAGSPKLCCHTACQHGADLHCAGAALAEFIVGP